MRYYCSECKKTIELKVYGYSKDKFGKALCLEHQKTYKGAPENRAKPKVMYKSKTKATPEAKKLFFALKNRGVPAQLEKWDGHKTIDIAIPEAKVNIEVDGAQHHYSHKQAMADLWRTFYSFKKGYMTVRIPNRLIKENLEKTADLITELLNASLDQLEDDYYEA